MKIPRWYRKYVVLCMTLLLASFMMLACQGLEINPNPAPDRGAPSSGEEDNAAIIEQPASSNEGDDAPAPSLTPAEEVSEPTTEAETSQDSAQPDDSTAATTEPESATPPAEPEEPITLARNQIFILPGAEPPAMDPHLSGDATSAEYVVEIYSGLMVYDQDLNLVPDIAASYEISEDGTVYTFKLKEDAVFQNGKPIRAEDFKWSFERACDPKTGSRTADTYLGDIIGCRAKLQGQADEVEGAQVIDELTLQLTIDEPKGFFLAKMTYPTAYVLDRETVESDPDWATTNPNGSGPFKLATYAPDELVIVLEKNENFYLDPKPILDRVIYLINAPINLMAGYEESLASLGLPDDITYSAIPVGISELSRVTDPNNLLSQEFVSTPGLDVNYIGFNVNKPPFDDVKVRQAFNLALDKQRMVRLVYQGALPVANGIVPPTMPGYQNPDLSDYEYDPEQALELIAESSYGDVSELPEITLHVSGVGGIVEPIVESYKQNLGIEIAVEQVDWPKFLEELDKPDPPYQMYQLGWIADYPDPQNFLEVLFHSDSAQNHGNYNNPEVDALLDQARGTQDVAERLALYQQVEQMILDDAAWIPLTFGVDNWLVKPYVHGFKVPPIKIPKFQYVSIAEHE